MRILCYLCLGFNFDCTNLFINLTGATIHICLTLDVDLMPSDEMLKYVNTNTKQYISIVYILVEYKSCIHYNIN